jgi:ribosomal protein S27AE
MSTPLDPEAVKLVEKALAELKKRNVTHDYCPRCETFDWNVEPIAIDVIPLRGVPATLPGSYWPGQINAIQFVCKNCGYTMFHNLNILDLAKPPTR